jgi:NADPH-dependent 2,4-dienoyl-CoA reductase/sulfur reductase-like enzyme
VAAGGRRAAGQRLPGRGGDRLGDCRAAPVARRHRPGAAGERRRDGRRAVRDHPDVRAGVRREFAGSLGTQVVKIFDHAAARTGLRDHEARAAGLDPVTVEIAADDHKAYYPGSHRIAIRVTGDRVTGRLLGLQLFGHRHAEIAKRIDIAATAIFHGMAVDAVSDLDLSYTPPLGSPWDAVQLSAQAWVREASWARPSG